MKRLKKTFVRALIVLGVIIVVLSSAFFIYASDYYHADSQLVSLIEESSGYSTSENLTILEPENPNGTGLIFYPGGKVEHTAYLPLLKQLQQGGITCILVAMPFNLAVFDINAADKIYSQFPDVERWFIGGHSLGGAMASDYYSKHQDKLKGLILLGAYIYGDVNASTALTTYGSEDLELDLSKITYTQNVYVIEGGNHAQFGNYGEQQGDGTATISREKQQNIAVQYILAFIEQQKRS